MKLQDKKVKIVAHYMLNLSQYEPKFWETLKETEMKGFSKEFIDDVSDLIGEYVDDGWIAFNKKYTL